MTAPLLIDVFPESARELEPLLAQEGESELAKQIETLRIYDRCRCGADFCAMIFTQARANRALRVCYETTDALRRAAESALPRHASSPYQEYGFLVVPCNAVPRRSPESGSLVS